MPSRIYLWIILITFFVEDATFVYYYIWVCTVGLPQKCFCVLYFVLFVSNQSLQQHQLLLIVFILDILTASQTFIIQPLLVQRLTVIQFIFVNFWVKLHQLFVYPGGIREILVLIVTEGQKRKSTRFRTELQFVVQVLNCLCETFIFYKSVYHFCTRTFRN